MRKIRRHLRATRSAANHEKHLSKAEPAAGGGMRLTADVILRAQVCVNPLRERELNLRGGSAALIGPSRSLEARLTL